MPTLCLFADTNLFLHYKALDQIDWSKVGDFDAIEIVVCPPVQREIDDLKDGRQGRRSERARKTASMLMKIAEHGPQQQRAASPCVMLDLDVTSQPKQGLADWLDYGQNDDCIIGHLAQFREDNSSADAHLLTRDSGPVLKAKTLGPLHKDSRRLALATGTGRQGPRDTATQAATARVSGPGA